MGDNLKVQNKKHVSAAQQTKSVGGGQNFILQSASIGKQENDIQLFNWEKNLSDSYKTNISKLTVPDATYTFYQGPEIDLKITIDYVAKATKLRSKYIKQLTTSENCKLDAYPDAAKKKTIGWGHNIDHDSTYSMGDHITKEQAYKLLIKDLHKAQHDLDSLVGAPQVKKLNLNPGQYEALTDLFFNVGIENLTDTRLIKNLKSGNLKGVPGEMDFVSSGGNFLEGLAKRRMKNIIDFTETTPTKEGVEALKTIKEISMNLYDKKYNKTSFLSKLDVYLDKRSFASYCDNIIAEQQKRLDTYKAAAKIKVKNKKH